MPNKFDELLKFPCHVDFKIIVDASTENVLVKLSEEFHKIHENSMGEIKGSPRASRNGKYISYTVPVYVENSDKLMRMYEIIGKLEYVMHII